MFNVICYAVTFINSNLLPKHMYNLFCLHVEDVPDHLKMSASVKQSATISHKFFKFPMLRIDGASGMGLKILFPVFIISCNVTPN